MESASVGIFLLIFAGVAIILATPLAIIIGGIISAYWQRTRQAERIPDQVTITIITFVLLLLVSCAGLMIWNPS